MAIAIIQTVGVFLASTVGFVTFMRCIHKIDTPTINFVAFGIGVAMALSGIFF